MLGTNPKSRAKSAWRCGSVRSPYPIELKQVIEGTPHSGTQNHQRPFTVYPAVRTAGKSPVDLSCEHAPVPPQLRRVGKGLQDKEMFPMKCHVCGSKLKPLVTDLPFKVSETTIVILKDLPLLQCDNCTEYFLEDPVMGRVEEILERVDSAAELEIIRYAA